MSDPVIGSVSVIQIPCSNGKTGSARYLGNGKWRLLGNTNGYQVDTWAWLVWAIKNKKVRASRAWGSSQGLHVWGQSLAGPHTFLDRVAPIAIEAAVALGIGAGIASIGNPALFGSLGAAPPVFPATGVSTIAVDTAPLQISTLSIPSADLSALSASDLTLAGSVTGAGSVAGGGVSSGGSSFWQSLFGKSATVDQIAQTAGGVLALASAPGGGGSAPGLGAPVSPAKSAAASPVVFVVVLLLIAAGGWAALG